MNKENDSRKLYEEFEEDQPTFYRKVDGQWELFTPNEYGPTISEESYAVAAFGVACLIALVLVWFFG